MSGECAYDLVAATGGVKSADGAAQSAKAATTAKKKTRRAPPPTASTFGIHGTSAIVANVGGEHTEPSAHPARKPIGTFGREVGASVTPAEYLHKDEGPLTASRGAATVNTTKFKKSAYHHEKTKPDVPLRYERPVMGLKTDKNFVLANAVENTLAVPTKAAPAHVPHATDHEDFGKVPQYITDIKAEINTRKQMMADMQTATAVGQERWSQLSEAEVGHLRNGLQQRWETLNKEYQAKGFNKTEIPSQRASKELLEKQLVAVEYAMQKLSRHHVFIFDDQK